MKEYQKHLFFGINTDDEERNLSTGDYTDGLNLDDGNILAGTGEILTNTKGNTVVPNPNLPAGTNTVIGSYSDRVGNSVIYFVYNSNNTNSIFRYFYATGTISLILQGAFLKFNTNFRITGVALFGTFLYYTDNLNPQRRINLAKLDNTQQIRYRIYFTKKYGVTSIGSGGFNFYPSFDQTPGTGVNLQVATTTVFSGTWNFDNASLTAYKNAFNASFGSQLTASIVDDYILVTGNNPGYQALTISNTGADNINYSISCENYYVQPYQEFQFNLARHTPTYPIGISSTRDFNPANKGQELLKNSFQFAYRYVFFDGEKSAISPYSRFTNPDIDSIYIKLDLYEETANKGDIVYYSSEIKYIELLVRTSNTAKFNLYSRYKYVPNFEMSFWNDKALQGISTTDTAKLFDSIPLISKTLEGHSGRLFLGNNTEGYDNIEPDINLNISFVESVYEGTAGNPFKEHINSEFKRGSKFAVGIVYYDEYNRSGGVNSNETMNVYIPHQGEKISSARPGYTLNTPGTQEISYMVTVANGTETKTYTSRFAQINFSINHIPPIWATTYQFVMTENLTYEYFWKIQFYRASEADRFTWYISGFDTESETGRSKPIVADYSNNAACFSAVEVWFVVEDGYVFESGDRIRVALKNGGDSGTTTDINFIDREIIEQRGKRVAVATDSNFWANQYIDFDNTSSVAQSFHIQAEVYRPKKVIDSNSVFYEIGKTYSISNPKTINRQHSVLTGTIQNGDSFNALGLAPNWQSYFGNTSGSSTKSRYDNDQPYERRRSKPYISSRPPFGTTYNLLVSYLPIGIWITNAGRPNSIIPEARQETKKSAVRFSNKFVQNTQINGLSSFEGLNEYIFPVENGEINRLIKNNDVILILQEKTSIAVYIEKNVFNDLSGQNVVSISDKVLGGNNELRGNYGTKHPESAVEMDNNIYWYDVTKGAVLKYAQDGITVVSSYKKQKYFAQKSRDIANTNTTVKGFVDPSTKKYFLDFGDVCWTYSENRNRWISRNSFQGQAAYQKINNNFVIFDATGNLWLQNSNVLSNNFFGVQYNSEIEFISGFQNPGVVKNWQNITIEASGLWEALEIANEMLQQSNLIPSDFVLKEGKYYAQFLRDANTPNTQNPVFRGDELKSIWIRIRLSNGGTAKIELYSTNCGYAYSAGHTN